MEEVIRVLSTLHTEEWIFKQLAPGNSAHHVHRAVRLQGTLDTQALQEGVAALVQRHDALRTVFLLEDEQPTQRVEAHADVRMTLVELQQPLTERESEVQRTLTHWVKRPFDNVGAPLFRVVLVQVAPDEHVLLLVAHSVVANEGFLHRIFGELLGQEPLLSRDVPRSLEADLAFWQEQLSDAETFLGLPLDRSRPARQHFHSAMYEFSLTQAETAQLKQWCAEANVAVEDALLGVYAVLLARYTRQKDLLIGTQLAGQVLPLRIDLLELPTAKVLAKQVQDGVASAADHPVLLDQLVQVLGIDRDPSYNPLVQVAFVYEGDASAEWIWVKNATSPFDLTLQVRESAAGIVCAFIYSEDLLDLTTVERMAGNWRTLLNGVLQGGEESVFHLPILTAGEVDYLERWNDVTADYPLDKCLHHLFEEQADRTPDAYAAIYEDEKLTYRELDQRANQLARYLQQHGVRAETMVGIYMERSIETVIALFAVLKAGGAYVPLDPAYPMERVLMMLEDSQVPVLLTEERFEDRLPELDAAVLCVDRDWSLVAQESTERVQSDVTPSNLSYVIFTSGSTGRPKGVMIEHYGIVNRMMFLQETYPLSTADRVLHKTPLAFDLSVFEFFWPVTSGAALVVTKPDAVQDSAYMVELIQKEQVTTMFYVPSMLQLLIEEPEFENCTQLKRVICSGEPLPFDMKQRFYARLPETDLINQYGPTEMTVEVTSYLLERGNTISYIPIGEPMKNTKMYVLDEWKQPVPVGVPGEMYLGGLGVARGYLKRPELTASVFLTDPFSKTPGARMYKTGDLAQRMPAGHLRYISRIDSQVKVRGLRIELGEIEVALLQHETVREAVVIVREDVPGRQQIVAYLIPEVQPEDVDVWELRRYLKQRMPEYMVPAAFVVLEAFPLSPSGKTDKRLLPKPELLDQGQYVAPATELEQQLAAIWGDVLRLERVSTQDNFFTMGGDSIQSIQVVSRVGRLGTKIHTEDLVKHQTIAALAAFIEAKSAQEQVELTDELLRELPYWTLESRREVTLLATDGIDEAEGVQAFEELEVLVAGEQLQKLQNDLMKMYRMQMSEVLMTALLRALQPDGGRHLWVIDVEGEAVRGSSNPTAYPMLLELDGEHEVSEQLKSIKEQSRQVPNRGCGYARLRYSQDAEIAGQLASLPQAQVWFCHSELSATGELPELGETREYLVRVDSQLSDEGLSVLFELSTALQGVADRFARELNQLIEQGATQQAQAFTPSDFAGAKLDANQLNQFLTMISKSNGGQS